MFTDLAWAAPPLTLVPVCLRKPPSPRFLVIKHWGQEEMVPRWQNTAIWSGAVVVIIIIIIIIFRQALPIQLQNTSASPCQRRAGLDFEKLLCPSAGTDAQNRIGTEQKQATTNKWKDSMLVLFGDGMRTRYERYLGPPSLAQRATSVCLSFWVTERLQ